MDQLRITGGTVDLRTGRVERRQPAVLTGRELALLVYLAERPDTTIAKGTLLAEVFGYHPAARTRVADTTLRRLRAKLGEDAAEPRHLVTVYGEGVRFVPLPEGSVALVGRVEELAAVREDGVHVVLGAGGMGKTQLARAAAREVAGALFVDLSSTGSLEDLYAAFARALGLDAPGASEPTITRRLAALRPPLVVLDNLEQLPEADAQVDRWLWAFRETRWLLTSQRRPELTAPRRELALAPLSPDDSRALVERLLGPQHDDAVTALVTQTGGVPLVLELAAARARVLGLPALSDQLRERGVGSLGGGEGRHGSVHAAVTWTVGLLEPAHREVLTRLSLFPGPFAAADAARFVDDLPAVETLERYHLLTRHGDGVWELPPTVRQVVRAERPATETDRVRFLQWCATEAIDLGAVSQITPDAVATVVDRWPTWHEALTAAAHDPDAATDLLEVVGRMARVTGLLRPPPSVWAAVPEADWTDRWRLALIRCAVGSGDLDEADRLLAMGEMASPAEFERLALAVRLRRIQHRRDAMSELLDDLRRVADPDDPHQQGVLAMNEAVSGEPAQRDGVFRRAERCFRTSPLDRAEVLVSRSFHAAHYGRPDRGIVLAERALGVLEGLRPNLLAGRALLALGFASCQLAEGGPDRETYLRARELFERIDQPAMVRNATLSLARAADELGDHEQSRYWLETLLAEPALPVEEHRYILVQRVTNALLASESDDVVDALDDLLALAAPEPSLNEPALCLLGLAAGLAGAVAPALAVLDRAAALRPSFGHNTHRVPVCRLPALRAAGRLDEADHIVEAVRPTLPVNQLHRMLLTVADRGDDLSAQRDAIVALVP
jgi:DNA-binding winged helix-turn-helix (wHTH) protein